MFAGQAVAAMRDEAAAAGREGAGDDMRGGEGDDDTATVVESEGDDDAATVAESVHAGDDDALDVDELLREIRAGVGRSGGEEDARADAEVASVMPEEVTGSHRPTHPERLSSGSVASFGGLSVLDAVCLSLSDSVCLSVCVFRVRSI